MALDTCSRKDEGSDRMKDLGVGNSGLVFCSRYEEREGGGVGEGGDAFQAAERLWISLIRGRI